MKITSTDHAEQLRNLQKNGQADKKEDLGFSRLLEEKGQAAPEKAAPSGPVSLMNNSALVGMIMANQGVGGVKTPQEQLESTLDKMDQYASALGDGGKTLKDIEPLAEDMRKAAGQLSETSRKLPEDHPLKGLTNEAAVVATVEAMKFKRGDYV